MALESREFVLGYGEKTQDLVAFGQHLAAVVSDAIEIEDVPGGATHQLEPQFFPGSHLRLRNVRGDQISPR